MPDRTRTPPIVPLLFSFGFSVVAWFTFGDYGISFDEYFRIQQGESVYRYYASLFSGDFSVLQAGPSDTRITYPSLFDLSNAVLRRLLPCNQYTCGHLLSLAFGLLASYATWRIGQRLRQPWLGPVAVLLLVCTPCFYGHLWFNPKDIPFAGTYTLGLWAGVVWLQGLPRPRWRDHAFVGLSIGLALGTRTAALLLPFWLALGWALHVFLQSDRRDYIREHARTWLLGAGLIAGIAFLTVFPFWPALHRNPFATVQAGVSAAMSFGFEFEVLFNGRYWAPSELPRSYLPVWFAITLPEIALVLLALLPWAVWRQGRSFRIPKRHADPTMTGLHVCWVYIGMATFGPPTIAVLRHATLYDGQRHFLFIVPALCLVLAGVFLETTKAGSGKPGQRTWRLACTGILLLGCMLSVQRMVVLHPYQYIAFNHTVGGLRGAEGRFETDYWGLSLRETVALLDKRLREEDPHRPHRSTPYRIHTVTAAWLVIPYLPADMAWEEDATKADFYISSTRLNMDRRYPGWPVVETQREGVVLSRAILLAHPSAETPIQGGLNRDHHEGIENQNTGGDLPEYTSEGTEARRGSP